MEVRIGIQFVQRELEIETHQSAEDVQSSLAAAMTSGDGGLFTLSDDKGSMFVVPADKIAYVEFSGTEQRRVGFGGGR